MICRARPARERARLLIDRIAERPRPRAERVPRVSGRTFWPLFSTRDTVTRATPAALATSSIVEFRFVTRAGWQAFHMFATADDLACQQLKLAP